MSENQTLNVRFFGVGMIVGIGNDLCAVERMAEALERRGQNFRNRICSMAEQCHILSEENEAAAYALRFAVKEACAKALGTGITDRVRWHDIAIDMTDNAIRLQLAEGALRRVRWLARPLSFRTHLTAEVRAGFASALVVIEAL